MNLGLNSTVRALTICAIAATLAAVSSRSWASKSSSHTSVIELNAYSQTSNRPTLILLYDLSTDQDWKAAASNLRSHFDIHFFDTTFLDASDKSLAQLHTEINLHNPGEYKISGAASSETVSTSYAVQYANETEAFILPSSSEDLFDLTILFHQLMDTQSMQRHESES